MYDIDISGLNDNYVLMVAEALEGLNLATVPGKFWLEFFPIFKHVPTWLPWTYSRKIAEYYKPMVEGVRDRPYDEIKLDMVSPCSREDSYMGPYLYSQGKWTKCSSVYRIAIDRKDKPRFRGGFEYL